MSEYKITFRVKVLGIFSNKSFTEVKVYDADSGSKAIEQAQNHIKAELSKNDLDPEEDGFTVEIVNVARL